MKRLFTLVTVLALSVCVCAVASAIVIDSNTTGSFEIKAGLSKTDVTSITIEASAAPKVAYTWSNGAWSANISDPETTFTISTTSSLTKKITAEWTGNNEALGGYGLTVAAPVSGAFDAAGVSLAPNAPADTSTKVTLATSGTPSIETISGNLSDVKIGDVVFSVSNP